MRHETLFPVWFLAPFVAFVVFQIGLSLVTGQALGPYKAFRDMLGDRRSRPIRYWLFMIAQLVVLAYAGGMLAMSLFPGLVLPWLDG